MSARTVCPVLALLLAADAASVPTTAPRTCRRAPKRRWSRCSRMPKAPRPCPSNGGSFITIRGSTGCSMRPSRRTPIWPRRRPMWRPRARCWPARAPPAIPKPRSTLVRYAAGTPSPTRSSRSAAISRRPFGSTRMCSRSPTRLDLFGRVRRGVEASQAGAEATAAARDALRVLIAAETARAYAQMCALGEQMGLPSLSGSGGAPGRYHRSAPRGRGEFRLRCDARAGAGGAGALDHPDVFCGSSGWKILKPSASAV